MPIKLDAYIGGDRLLIEAELTGGELIQIFRDWVNKVGVSIDPVAVAKLADRLNVGTDALVNAETNA